MHQAHFAVPMGTATRVSLRIVPLRVGVRRVEALLGGGQDGSRILEAPIHDDETVGKAASRAAREQLGLEGSAIQVATLGTPASGIEVVFALAVRPPAPGRRLPKSHVASASWRSCWEPGELQSGQHVLLDAAIAQVAAQVEHADAGFMFVHTEFTVTELRRVHECFLRTEIDPSNFRKRVSRWVDDQRVRELSRRRPTATRPARLYSVRIS